MLKRIEGICFDEKRALHSLSQSAVVDCVFAGSSNEDFPLKEARDVMLDNCTFFQPYALWNAEAVKFHDSRIDENAQSALWYCENVKITDSDILGSKALRGTHNVVIHDCNIDCHEFGWMCQQISIADCKFSSDYLFLNSRDVTMDHVQAKGTCACQYTENMDIRNCFLHGSNALWHSKNVTITDSVIMGEHLGWFSENLTLVGCKIIGKQPLCYCKNLVLINCSMEEAEYSFEYSDVSATIEGHVDSVRNPRSGEIILDSVGRVIVGDAIMECSGKVIVRE